MMNQDMILHFNSTAFIAFMKNIIPIPVVINLTSDNKDNLCDKSVEIHLVNRTRLVLSRILEAPVAECFIAWCWRM